MYSFAGMDLQLFSLNLNNRLCHSGVFGWISCDNENITNF
jgi:hypothetical protein